MCVALVRAQMRQPGLKVVKCLAYFSPAVSDADLRALARAISEAGDKTRTLRAIHSWQDLETVFRAMHTSWGVGSGLESNDAELFERWRERVLSEPELAEPALLNIEAVNRAAAAATAARVHATGTRAATLPAAKARATALPHLQDLNGFGNVQWRLWVLDRAPFFCSNSASRKLYRPPPVSSQLAGREWTQRQLSDMSLFAPLEASEVVRALSEGAPDARAQLDAVLALAAVRRVELVRGTRSLETRP